MDHLIVIGTKRVQGRILAFTVSGNQELRQRLAALEMASLSAVVTDAVWDDETCVLVAGKALLLASMIEDDVATNASWVRQALATLGNAHAAMMQQRKALTGQGMSEKAASLRLAGKYDYFQFDWTALLNHLPRSEPA
jgi:hypothetical protein